jgi:hypothetical protein
LKFNLKVQGELMKLMFAMFFALLVTATAFAQGTYTGTGAVKYQEKVFGPFVNSASTTLAAGSAVCLDLTADDGIAIDYCIDGYPPIGVVTASCAVGARCKVQTKGMFETVLFDPTNGNAEAGNSAYVGANGYVYGDTSDTNKQPLGIFLDAASSTAAVQVFITR